MNNPEFYWRGFTPEESIIITIIWLIIGGICGWINYRCDKKQYGITCPVNTWGNLFDMIIWSIFCCLLGPWWGLLWLGGKFFEFIEEPLPWRKNKENRK